MELTLSCLKSSLSFIYHVNPAFSSYEAAVSVSLFKRSKRISNFHNIIPLLEYQWSSTYFLKYNPKFIGGRNWDWTSDPFDVNEVLSRWAIRPSVVIYKSLLQNIEALYIAVLYMLQVIFESFSLYIDSNYVWNI